MTANLSSLTIRNGNATTGGGIYNLGTLTLSNSILSGNAATGNGGAVATYTALTVNYSIISGNAAAGGGGIFNNSGT